MHHKDIKAIIRKQLKTNCRDWKRLKKREKREIAKKYWMKCWQSYDFKKEVETDKLELLGIEQQKLTSGMMNLNGMARFIESHENDVLFRLNRKRRNPSCLQDKELIFIDNLLDDTIINRLLSYDGFTPSMREFFPSNFLRAELLKSIKYPEISYRKFCGEDKTYQGHERIRERFFGKPRFFERRQSWSKNIPFARSVSVKFPSSSVGSITVWCAGITLKN
jgi:hypothetical protein